MCLKHVDGSSLQCSVRLKVIIYSLEALQPTETTTSKLPFFQLKVNTTNINRANKNDKVYRTAMLKFETKRGCDPEVRSCRIEESKY